MQYSQSKRDYGRLCTPQGGSARRCSHCMPVPASEAMNKHKHCSYMQVGFCQQRPDAAAARAAASALRRLGAAAEAPPHAALQPALGALVALLLQPCRDPRTLVPGSHDAPAPAAHAAGGAVVDAPAPGHPVETGLRLGLAPGLPESSWYGAAEEAVATLYVLHPHPARLAAAVLERLAAAALGGPGTPMRHF